MKHVFILGFFLCLMFSIPSGAFAAPKKPNFVFFLVDDMGWGDIGCYGSTFHETPNLDKLASEGMKFTNAYAACTVCSPSRAAIITGQYPGRLHLTDWITGHGRRNAKLLIPKWKMKMDHELTTLPEALKPAGYRSQFVGKWHLMPIRGEDFKEHYPTSHGFDINIAGREWGQPKGRGKYFSPFGMPNLDDGNKGDFLTDRLTDEAVSFIEDSKDKPFLLYFSYYTVHGPIMAKPELLAKYKKKAAGFNNERGERVHPAYAGMVESLDDSVGRVLAALKKRGLDENTVVMFTADNGGDSTQSSGGLRGRKALAYEGGTREPAIVKWPGHVKPGTVCDVPVIGMDFYPTMLEMAGLPAKPKSHVDGISLVPWLKDPKKPADRESLFWHYPHYHRTTPYGAIRQGDFKLIEFFENGKLELYDLKNDPAESKDLSESEPAKAKALHQAMLDWRKEVGAQMPTANPNHGKAAANQPTGTKSTPTKPIASPLGKVRASSQQNGNPPEAALDQRANTRWAANGGSVPQWWMLEFAKPRDIKGVKIQWKNQTWFQYKIEVSSDGKKWTTAVDESKSKKERKTSEHTFELKRDVKFLRVSVSKLGSGWVSFMELTPVFEK
jgi:arylsulfatase A